METCTELTDLPEANTVRAVNSHGDADKIAARRSYMREYMRRRRAAARNEPMTKEFATLSPTIQAAVTLDEINRAELDFKYEALDLDQLCDHFVGALKRFHYGDIRGVENALRCQAATLDRIFNAFIRRGCREDAPEYREMEFRIAFRAQSQFRATLATLAAIKNPARVAFVNQANIASGPQQVNNRGPITRKREQ
jgi:hypothetical protein